ncbi:MAG TPA: bifunctional diaminohydroxyphosphoribosylaminopyrimidine deaminase/5-amino-6-(5-phosphoribosylamino)uracil reductase RibD [Candidatus Saccharimonadales bacterium]|nr:bifunctional diaminohydroxyphosphoribosylaminopyrimidine deaminase/5-amino-6-(5-phosphoribosylamino)uracil reductase RibD [Candidatus Saccharimonadales bacterium]
MNNDAFFLTKALKLAKKGEGLTFPNPMVGCLIVKDEKIIAKGYHQKAGYIHAERVAIEDSSEDLNGSTMYVNLEPCNHHGRTPPCTDLIIKSGISRVVCSTQDPNLGVDGQGIKKLQDAGIDVTVGILEKESRILNEQFFTFYEKNRPFVAIKFASSLDGKIATRTGNSKWITNDKTRNFARLLRGKYHAILIGVNTVIVDDPNLGVQIKGKNDPLRIILDSTLKIPLNAQVLRDKNVLIVTTINADKEKEAKLKQMSLELIKFNTNGIDLKNLMEELKNREIISIFVEGGSSVLGSFADARLVDKVYAFHAPILIGGISSVSAIAGDGIKNISEALRLENLTYKKFGDNTLTIGYVL